ncbi:phBC6A51 family helix-turn-helix protein [Streptomyces sp. NPDC012769]|uniref:phBC6A51 family helix-turn-helix protein n=1 Tax=Streptomyces sp. NPDC012769 TaxID=3364848 RepID=UPI00367BB5C2
MAESEITYFEPWQLEVVLFIERVHSTTGGIPTDADIVEHIRFTKKIRDFSVAQLKEFREDPRFHASMDSRGIPVANTGNLSQRQMAAASVMLNLTDRRSDEKKLRDIGVSTEEYSNWMQNSVFAEYMRQRSEVLINNSVHEAHMGLMRGVRQGNTASIKLYYELSGRYNPNEENQVNIRMVLGRVVETIQKYVTDPDVLNSLAVELSQIAIEAGSPVANNNNKNVKGELA